MNALMLARAPNPSATFLAMALMGCQEQEPPAAANQKPYWLTKPTLPASPSRFCPTVSQVLADAFQAREIRCKDGIAGDYGVRGKREGSEIVILQGANEDWFAFAYLVSGAGSDAVPLDTSILAGLVSNVEAALID